MTPWLASTLKSSRTRPRRRAAGAAFGAALSACGILGIAALASMPACTQSTETPNPYWQGGGIGGDNQECRPGSRCDNNGLVCVVAEADAGAFCRSTCAVSATDDPCGVGLTCVQLSGAGTDEGACFPAAMLHEDCGRCDEGLRCIDEDGVDAGTVSASCHFTCRLADIDGGSPCPDAGTCSDFGDPIRGFCR